MSFKFAVLKESAKPVRGPRVTCVSTHDSESVAIAAAETMGAESSDNFYVVEVVARLARVMQVTREERPRYQALEDANKRAGDLVARAVEDLKTRARFQREAEQSRATDNGRLNSGHPAGGQFCWGCSLPSEEHPNDTGCETWHGKDDL